MIMKYAHVKIHICITWAAAIWMSCERKYTMIDFVLAWNMQECISLCECAHGIAPPNGAFKQYKCLESIHLHSFIYKPEYM